MGSAPDAWDRPHPPDWYCPATSRQTGVRCGRVAGHGTDHRGFGLCSSHAGRTPGPRKQGLRLMAEAAMEQVRNGYGARRPNAQIGPTILEEISRTVGCIAFVEEQLDELAPGELVSGVRFTRSAVGGVNGDVTTTEVAAQVSVWVQLHQQERKHLATVLDLGVRAGIEMRRLKLAEQEGELMGLLLRAAMEEFPAESQPAAYARIRARLGQLRAS